MLALMITGYLVIGFKLHRIAIKDMDAKTSVGYMVMSKSSRFILCLFDMLFQPLVTLIMMIMIGLMMLTNKGGK